VYVTKTAIRHDRTSGVLRREVKNYKVMQKKLLNSHCESKKCHIFHKVVWRHVSGMTGSLIDDSITNLLLSLKVKEF